MISLFGKSVDDVIDSILTIYLENTSDKIHAEVTPALLRDRKGFQNSLLDETRALAPFTSITITYILPDETLYTRLVVPSV